MSTLTFLQALTQAEAQARSTLDVALYERLSAAVALVQDGRVFQTTDGTWQVDSTSREGLVYSVNGTCSCDEVHFNKPPKGLCKHRLAMYLSQRVMTLMQQPSAPVVPAAVQEPVEVSWDPKTAEAEAPVDLPHGIDPRHIVLIQGKPFVKFAGLLDLAHKRGLQVLKVDWTSNDAELSLAHAVAVFPFGTFGREW
jgi:hypothetical protein